MLDRPDPVPRAILSGRSLRLVHPEQVVEIEVPPAAAPRNPPDAEAIRELLAESRRVLAVLKAERSMLDGRLASLGRRDPIREVTGRSAIDLAIEEAAKVVAELESACGE